MISPFLTPHITHNTVVCGAGTVLSRITHWTLCRFTVGSMIRADFPTERGSDLLWFYIDYCKDTCQFVDLKSCTKRVIVILLQHAASHVRSKEYIYYLYLPTTYLRRIVSSSHILEINFVTQQRTLHVPNQISQQAGEGLLLMMVAAVGL